MGMKNFFVGVKGVIINDNNEVLLLQSKKGYWELPGGRIDDNEDLIQTLNRELNEELTNIRNIEIGEVVHAIRMPFDLKDDLGLVLIFYKVKADFYDHVQISDEHQDFRWVNLEEAKVLVDDEVKKVIAKLS